jgi:hypothetical protein
VEIKNKALHCKALQKSGEYRSRTGDLPDMSGRSSQLNKFPSPKDSAKQKRPALLQTFERSGEYRSRTGDLLHAMQAL